MSPQEPIPEKNCQLYSGFDRLFCVIGFVMASWVSSELFRTIRSRADELPTVVFFGCIALFMAVIASTGAFLFFSRLCVTREGISVRAFRTRFIPWHSITELRFCGQIPNTGFTPKLLVRTADGDAHLIPIADHALRGYFNGVSPFKAHEQGSP